MDAARRHRIRTSFEALAPRADELVGRFYDALFAEHPEVRPIFPEEMTGQRRHLLTALALIVRHLDDLDSLRTPLMKLGARHAAYGAQRPHYPVVRDTLLRVMAEIAGPRWTDQLHDDWTIAINAIAETMIGGAEAPPARAAA